MFPRDPGDEDAALRIDGRGGRLIDLRPVEHDLTVHAERRIQRIQNPPLQRFERDPARPAAHRRMQHDFIFSIDLARRTLDAQFDHDA